MPTERIPFLPAESPAVKQIGGGGPASINVLVDQGGVLRRRPGIQELSSAGSAVIDSAGIDGLYATSTGDVFAVAAPPSRAIYRIVSGGGTSLPTSGAIAGTGRPVFAETEAMVAIANGSDPLRVLLADYTAAPLAGSPPKCTHIAFNSSRLLLNDVITDRSKINYSDLAAGNVTTGHETWNGTGDSGFFSAEARPDPVTAIDTNTNEVFVWGATTLEIYGPDPLFRFARLTAREYGCVAPYSIVKSDGMFAWLDPRGRFIRSDGRAVQDMSGGVSGTLSAADAAGCYGYRVDEGDTDCLVWSLPASSRTLVYQEGVGWSRWAQQTQGGQWARFPVLSHTHNPITGDNIVGLTGGRVCRLAWDVADDLGEPIPAFVETGYIDHGSSKSKTCSRVRFTLERGATTTNTEPVAFVQWSDRPGAWSAPKAIGIGTAGNTRPEVILYSLGTYRRRAWRFSFSTGELLSLVRAEEDFDWNEE